MAARTDEERAYYSLNRRVYPWLAPVYDTVASPLSHVRHEVAEIAVTRQGMMILDVATGTGAQAAAFAARGAQVVGVDLAGAMLRIASRKARPPALTFQWADATALPFSDGKFDASCISFALHEMPPDIRARVMTEIVRVTRAAGTVIVVDYALPSGRIARPLVRRFVSLYEGDRYVEFVGTDPRTLLAKTGIDVRDDRRVLLGAVRILCGSKAAHHGSARASDLAQDAASER